MNSHSGSSANATTVDALREQVQKRLKEELGETSEVSSREYSQFKRDNTPSHHGWYERAARFCGGLIKMSAGKNEPVLRKQLETAHIDVEPGDALALSILVPLGVFFASIFFTFFLPFAVTGTPSLYYVIFSMVLAAMTYFPLANAPKFLANRWKQAASNQMVLCVFYMVTYMRHTPNMELALEFAADHIGPPLSLDLKKVLWDVETERYQSVSESLEHYLEKWRDDAREFVESIHLVQGSLYESSNERRLTQLDKSLDVMLEETYEKMLHYAQDLKSPMTMLHMLGIILPILGLVILPLAVSFFDTHWTILLTLYNVLLPVSVYYLGRRILASRPTGYGQADLQPIDSGSRKRMGPAFEAVMLSVVLFLIGVSPLVLHTLNPALEVSVGSFSLMGYMENKSGQLVGPYGLGAALLSLSVTLSFGLGLAWYYKRRTKSLIAVRRRTKKLENEFASALFQLGNRIGDGLPAEIAFGKVAATMEGTSGGRFFGLVANNITRLGMGVDEALFDSKHGALVQFPSNLIQSSMKVLVESSRKGPREASRALMSMSNYIKEMHRVDERLKDLLSEVISSMKSQISFLLPTIAGIVIGITSMITTVLGQIQMQAQEFTASTSAGSASSFSEMFGLGVPTYYFQIVVGLYVVQVVWILSYLINGVENGVDELSEQYIKGKSLMGSTLLYVGISFVIMLIFNMIAGQLGSMV